MDLALLPSVSPTGEVEKPLFKAGWTEAEEAPSNSVRNLLLADGRLWIGTSNGLTIWVPRSGKPVKRVTQGEIHRRTGTLAGDGTPLGQPEFRAAGDRPCQRHCSPPGIQA